MIVDSVIKQAGWKGKDIGWARMGRIQEIESDSPVLFFSLSFFFFFFLIKVLRSSFV